MDMNVIPKFADLDDDRITKKAARGEHIALTCKNHPDLLWSTKNIGFIGARHIFFDLFRECKGKSECECSANDLILHPKYSQMPEV